MKLSCFGIQSVIEGIKAMEVILDMIIEAAYWLP